MPCLRALPSPYRNFLMWLRWSRLEQPTSVPILSVSSTTVFFYPSFKISDQPFPSSPLGSHVSHTTTDPCGATAPPAATTCLLRAPKPAQLYSATGSVWAQPLPGSGSSMAIVTRYVVALTLVHLEGPAVGTEALALLWDIYSCM